MYNEGDNYYFIHRSFQEYFTALYFSSLSDEKLLAEGKLFDKFAEYRRFDNTFKMLYSMVPQRIERFIFLPKLEEIFSNSTQTNTDYWGFLSLMYPTITYTYGETLILPNCLPKSNIYSYIIDYKKLLSKNFIDNFDWDSQIADLPHSIWVQVYADFLDESDFDPYPDYESIPEDKLHYMYLSELSELPSKYIEYFGEPDQVGISMDIEIDYLRKNKDKYPEVIKDFESSKFPLMEEFINVKNYYEILKNKYSSKPNFNSLFE